MPSAFVSPSFLSKLYKLKGVKIQMSFFPKLTVNLWQG